MKELKEVENHLILLSQKLAPSRWQAESYIGAGQSDYQFLNLKVPHIRQAAKTEYSFRKSNINRQWQIWNHIWNKTSYFEAALSAAHFASSRPLPEIWQHQDKLIQWQRRVDNWALSDELSSLYSRLLEGHRQSMLPVLKTWNASPLPWERRQSLVSLLFYSRLRTKALPPAKILSFVKPLINDEHYYVQKAVGWTLRECWNLYPEPTFSFMLKHAGKIPPAGWTAATEKLNKKDKSKLMAKRKAENNRP